MAVEVISRSSPVPLHYQLREMLRAGISQGEWHPGQRIPTESELCSKYRVSRITVRQAVAALVSEGLLYRAQGRGTFVVSPRVSHVVSELVSFTEEMAQRGFATRSRLRGSDVIRPSDPVRRALQLGDGELVIRIERVRLADGDPLALQTVYLSARRFEGLDVRRLERESLYRVLERDHGVQMVRAQEIYRPVVLKRPVAALLHVSVRIAAFEVERTTFDSENRPVEFVRSILRGDRMQLTLDLIRRGARR